MKRFWRIAWNVTAVASALLCAASCVLLVRSFWQMDGFYVARRTKTPVRITDLSWCIQSNRGEISAFYDWTRVEPSHFGDEMFWEVPKAAKGGFVFGGETHTNENRLAGVFHFGFKHNVYADDFEQGHAEAPLCNVFALLQGSSKWTGMGTGQRIWMAHFFK